MLEWLLAFGLVFFSLTAFLDARSRLLDKHLEAQEREKATPKRRHHN
ncbi:MAG: hypothetical protein ACOX3D_09035 [Syntrophomonadales bacterium]|jgi:hypothetical protein